MIKINVSKTDTYPQPSWPQELKNAGFVGEMDIISDGITAIIVRPGVNPETAKASIKLAIKQLDLKASIQAGG